MGRISLIVVCLLLAVSVVTAQYGIYRPPQQAQAQPAANSYTSYRDMIYDRSPPPQRSDERGRFLKLHRYEVKSQAEWPTYHKQPKPIRTKGKGIGPIVSRSGQFYPTLAPTRDPRLRLRQSSSS